MTRPGSRIPDNLILMAPGDGNKRIMKRMGRKPKKSCRVRFDPAGVEVVVPRGTTVLDACLKTGIRINSGCGGKGSCGKCRVRIVSGSVKSPGAPSISPDDAAAGWTLACKTLLAGPEVRVEVPGAGRERIIYVSRPDEAQCPGFAQGDYASDPFWSQGPVCTKIDVSPPRPTRDDPVTDLDRLVNAIRALPGAPAGMKAGIEVLRPLGGICREADWSVRAWLSRADGEAEIVNVEGKRRVPGGLGAAVDIGTTSVVACLCDLGEKKPLAFARCLNSQAARGADVITRIIHASSPSGLRELRELVLADVNALVAALSVAAGVNASDICAMEVAANTTMTQIALGVDPAHIRKEPYVATANFFPAAGAAELGIRIHPRAPVHFMPCVSSYVGGDMTAGVIAVRMHRSEDLRLLIDLGTNGEMVLGCRDWLVCCSCSVGPAFEGSGVTSGMLAEAGAIEDVVITDSGVEFSAIGGVRPAGICGSGLIKAFSHLLGRGIIDRAAKFQHDCGHPGLRTGKDGLEFLVAQGRDRDIVVTQPDLDNLLRSKAAVFSASSLLVRKMGLSIDDVSEIIVSGGFGTHLSFEDAVAIGMLHDQPVSKFRFAGNTSLAGARAGLSSLAAMEEAAEVARKMTYIELSGDNAYHEEFVQACFLPHTDLNLFPSARR